VKSNGEKATALLLIVFAGYAASYPFRESLTGFLLNAFFATALAGGIADWYGVVALFRKPLGIGFRTEIIPKSRDRLLEDLISLVDSELLTKEVLKNRIDATDFSSEIINYLNQHGGRQDISGLISAIINDTAISAMAISNNSMAISNSSNVNDQALILSEKIKTILNEVNFEAFLFKISDHLLSSDQGHKLLDRVTDEAMEIIAHSQVNTLISDIIDGVLEEIRNDSQGKSIFKRGLTVFSFGLLKGSGFRSEKIAGVLQGEALKYLKNVKGIDPAYPAVTTSKMTSVILELSSSISNALKKDESIRKKIYGFVFDAITDTGLKNGSDAQFQLSNTICDAFIADSGMRDSINKIIAEYLRKLVDDKHEYLGGFIREKFEAVSAREFSRMLEEKAWDDLQLIRINGTLVGGFAGLLFALVSMLLERMIA